MNKNVFPNIFVNFIINFFKFISFKHIQLSKAFIIIIYVNTKFLYKITNLAYDILKILQFFYTMLIRPINEQKVDNKSMKTMKRFNN